MMTDRLKWSVGLLAGWMLACGEPAPVPTTAPASSEATSVITQQLSASSRPGMGATLYGGGVTFRVWAPLASRVWVTGDFNGWGRTELGKENNGNFSGDVSGAAAYQKYKYITANEWGGESTARADPRSAWVENSAGASIIHDPNNYTWTSSFGSPGFNELVIYEMHVGTFHDKSPNDPGNWASAIEKLDYLAGLGVNMVQVMPVFEFPGDYSWGYNPSFPFAPEESYGTPWDMKHFVDEANKRGIGVIFDVVHNHWGPNDLPMWCFSNNCLGNGGEYFYTDNRKATPWGDSRPDYGRPEVRQYIRDSMMMLLHEYHASGLRWDATKYIRTIDGSTPVGNEAWDLFRNINNEIDGSQPWKISIAEDFGGGDSITGPTSSGAAGFDSQWAAEFVHPVRAAVIEQNDSNRNMVAVRDAITQRFNGNPFKRVIYSESHDEVANGHARVPEEIWPGQAAGWAAKKRSTLAAGIVFTSPGIPMLFQGQEFLEDGFFAAEDPLDWDKAGEHAGITQLYRDLIKLRRNWYNNTRGLRGDYVNVHHVNNTNKVIAYHRKQNGGPGDDVVVVANFSNTTFQSYNIGFPSGGDWHLRFNSDASVYSSNFGNTPSAKTKAYAGGKDGLDYNASFAIGPYTVLIFSQ
ncbi:alpha-amylase family glycosyl hydrolase [Myxococcaceae bacterium GXIMD 01537]